MALQYLLSPSFQVEGISGKPLVGGWIEVFLHDNYTEAGKVITKKDFDGTDNPFKVTLNAYGMATIIVDDSNVYDVFCYNIFGSLVWSRTNVSVNVGGGGGSELSAILPLVINEGVISNNGSEVNASGDYAWAEGEHTSALAKATHAEGRYSSASALGAHAEGEFTQAQAQSTHAEGYNTRATKAQAHSEGRNTSASGSSSHAEGQDTTASGSSSHAEGRLSTASGDYSHASGYGTRATGEGSTAVGKYNDDGTALFVVGDGTANNERSDCFKVDSNGETWVKIGGVLTKITSLGGGSGIPIYSTLQDAITDQANLPVGTIFETNGFHTSGDGGAARYLVSSTGTANGMDVIAFGAGKYALFQWSNEVTPEQLGAVGDGNTDDTAVFDYIINYFSSVLGDMQVRRTIRGSMSKRYKVNALHVHDVRVYQCVLRGSGTTTGYGIHLGDRAIIERCILFDFINAIYTNDEDFALNAVVTGCTIAWCGNGIALQGGTSQETGEDNILIENNYISRLGTLGHSTDDTPPNWDNTGCGIWLNGNWKNVNIVNNVLEYNGYAGLRLQCDRTDLEPSCTVTENYFEGNKFSAIRILMPKRPCVVSIFGNQMSKYDTNVFFTTGIYCSSAVMSSSRIESPYGEYIGVATSNNGSDVISVNNQNLRASNISIYPSDLTAKTFQLIPAKCANSRYASRQMLHIDLYVRSPDPSFTMNVSYIDRNNNAQTTSVSLTPNRHEVIEIPLIDVNLYDSTNYPVTCVVTSADGWFYIMITDMWIK